MTMSPEPMIDYRDQDDEHIRLLSTFHYVIAVVHGLISLLPIIHLTIGIAIVNGALDGPNPANPVPPLVGWIFIVVASVIIVLGLSCAICTAVAGRRLRQFRGYTFCFVVACVECLFFPLGTTLGVLTLLVLMRPSVKEKFDRQLRGNT